MRHHFHVIRRSPSRSHETSHPEPLAVAVPHHSRQRTSETALPPCSPRYQALQAPLVHIGGMLHVDQQRATRLERACERTTASDDHSRASWRSRGLTPQLRGKAVCERPCECIRRSGRRDGDVVRAGKIERETAGNEEQKIAAHRSERRRGAH